MATSKFDLIYEDILWSLIRENVGDENSCEQIFPNEPEYWCQSCLMKYISNLEYQLEGDR